MATPRSPLIRTAAGTNPGSFAGVEWGMLGFNTLIWGSSFLFIAIGLDAFTPGMVAWLRIVLAVGVLAVLPSARAPIDRTDWTAVTIVAIAGNAGPALLFAFAEQTVESSVAGMLTAAVPLLTAAIAFTLGQRSLRRIHLFGLIGGLMGVILLTIPSLTGARPATSGVIMVLLAVLGYALTSNVLVPLAQKYGSIPVIFRALLLSTGMLIPFGLIDLGENRVETGPVLAVIALGLLSTGTSRVVQASMIGRVGAPRASIVGYLIPVVALILGVMFRSDDVAWPELVGLVVVIGSALMVTRAVNT